MGRSRADLARKAQFGLGVMPSRGSTIFKYSVAGIRLGVLERRASVLDCGGPPPLFSRKPSHVKRRRAARTPKPRGIFHPALKIGHSFIDTALAATSESSSSLVGFGLIEPDSPRFHLTFGLISSDVRPGIFSLAPPKRGEGWGEGIMDTKMAQQMSQHPPVLSKQAVHAGVEKKSQKTCAFVCFSVF
jgi:hypothetical protein